MRMRRSFRPALELMPSKDVPSDAVLVPFNPLLPIHIPTTPPPVYVNPNLPIHIDIDMPYYETIVGPDDSSSPPPLGTPRDDMC